MSLPTPYDKFLGVRHLGMWIKQKCRQTRFTEVRPSGNLSKAGRPCKPRAGWRTRHGNAEHHISASRAPLNASAATAGPAMGKTSESSEKHSRADRCIRAG